MRTSTNSYSSFIAYHALQYNQVPRILTPVVLVLDKLPSLNDDKVTRVFVESVWGDMETAR